MHPKIKNIKKTCDSCPSQWEIELKDGHMIYVRYRWGCLSIEKSKNPTTKINDAIGGIELFGEQLGHKFDGTMKQKAMLKYLNKALELNQPN